MPPPYITLLEFIQNGESVDATVANRPLQQLAQRDDYLKAIVDILTSSRGIYDINAEISVEVIVGAAVYWHATNLRYEPALAVLNHGNDGTYTNVADSAYVVGVCVSKTGPTRGSIVYAGRIDRVDFSQTVPGGAIVPGPYFLSSTEPGKMVKQRPPIGIHVMFGLKDEGVLGGTSIVMPTTREMLESHIHYTLDLKYGNIVSTTNPGWTNILDPNVSPAGARFRYKVEDDAPINNLFPLYPPENIYFEIEGIGANSKVIIDLNGVWWIDTVYDPDDFPNTMKLYYARMIAKTTGTMVTSLRPYAPGPLSFVDCNGNTAHAGDLLAKLDLVLSTGANDTPGYIVFKELTGNQQFKLGPVVEDLLSDSPEISIRIVPDTQTPPVLQGVTNLDGSKAGKLAISFNNPASLANEGIPSLVTLFNARQEDYGGSIPYVGLPPGFPCAVGYRFDLPQSGLSGAYKFYFYCWLLASVSGVIPTLSCDYTVIPKALDDALLNMSGATTGSDNLTVPIVSVTAGDYELAALLPNTGIVVNPGEQIHIVINRNDSSYSGSVGLLRAFYTMSKV